MADLTTRASALFATVSRHIQDEPELADITAEVDAATRAVGEAMRVAIVGQIKRGKSTLVNGMLRGRLVATGTLETTFNVVEFKHADTESLVIHFLDGRAPVRCAPDELDQLANRTSGAAVDIATIERIEVGCPNALLQHFRLVDTPGLNSVYGTDEQNTLRHLGKTVDSVEAASAAQLAVADTMLFMFSRSIGTSEVSLTEELRGPVSESATPLRAIGVLSRCDNYWPPDPESRFAESIETYDPLTVGRSIAASLMDRDDIRRLFYSVEPVIGLLAQGAATMREDELESLVQLAQVEPDVISRRLRDAERFANRDFPDLPVATDRRRALIERLGNYGTFRATTLLREGAQPEQLPTLLEQASGVSDLRSLAVSHFGNRATLIKLDRELAWLTAMIDGRRRAELGAGAGDALDAAADAIQRFRSEERGVAELALIAAFYRGDLDLTPTLARHLIELTGEHGRSIFARLGLAEDSSVDAALTVATSRRSTWVAAASQPLASGALRAAARQVERSYARLMHRLTQARELLHLDD